MKEIVIISGKGGTGKTSITAAFASLASNIVVADCDVDAADLHLLLKPDVKESQNFIGGKIAKIDNDKCLHCGICKSICRYNAISDSNNEGYYSIDQMACEGCAVCAHFCPSDAISMEDNITGRWFISETRVGPMVHAKLNAGGENSGKLVTLIRNKARDIAQTENARLIITDGPPGIGCPVIASFAGASHIVIITEPTMSGIHDLERVVELAMHFNISASIIVNKADINPGKTAEIKTFAANHGLSLLGSIPYDSVFTAAQLAGQSIVEFSDGLVSKSLTKIWNELSQTLNQ